jgi:DNA-binding FadR family transcriptional regulator
MKTCAEAGQPMVEEDRRFHQLLFESLGNQTLLKLLDVFWLTFRKASHHADIHDDDPLRTWRDHADIAAAVAAKDIGKVKIALGNHYDGLQGRLARAQVHRAATTTDQDGQPT